MEDLHIIQTKKAIINEIKNVYDLMYTYGVKFTDKDVRTAFFELSHVSLWCHYRSFYTGINEYEFFSPFKDIAINQDPTYRPTIHQNYYHSSNFNNYIRIFSLFELALNVICDKTLSKEDKERLQNFKAEELKKEFTKINKEIPIEIYNKQIFKSFSKVPFPRKLNVILKNQNSKLGDKAKDMNIFFECFRDYRNSMHFNFLYHGEDKIRKTNCNGEQLTFNFKNNKVVIIEPYSLLQSVNIVAQAIKYTDEIFKNLDYNEVIEDPTYEKWF